MRLLLFFFYIFSCCGCATYKTSSATYVSADPSPRETEAASHWLYLIVPRHRDQIRWYDLGHWTTWGLFGNDDDGIFGEKIAYKLDKPISTKLALFWGARNPFHNFCFYVIGQAYMQNSETTLVRLSKDRSEGFSHKSYADTVFAGRGSSLFIGFHGFKPYISFRLQYAKTKQTEFYLGWRERGNFGMKLIPVKSYNKN